MLFIVVSVNVLVILIHPIVIWLLVRIKRNNAQGLQKYLLISLYMAELAYSMISMIIVICKHVDLPESVRKHVVLTRTTFAFLTYFLIMSCITLDRFLVVRLGIKYPLYCSNKKLMCLLLGSLMFTLVISTASSITWVFYQWDITTMFYVYIYPVLMAVYILCILVTYGYIFRKLKRNWKAQRNLKRQIDQNNQPTRSNKSRFKVYIPSLIILTFCVFVVVPVLMKIVDRIFYKLPFSIGNTNWVLFPVGFIVDATIYIWNVQIVQKKFKNISWKRVRRIRNCKANCE